MDREKSQKRERDSSADIASMTPSAAKKKKGKKRRTFMKMVTPSAKNLVKKSGILPSQSIVL
jgi:flagellum-specific peptidoglycan hydrolase FlgJ